MLFFFFFFFFFNLRFWESTCSFINGKFLDTFLYFGNNIEKIGENKAFFGLTVTAKTGGKITELSV